MGLIDWERIKLDGDKAYCAALHALENAIGGLSAEVDRLSAFAKLTHKRLTAQEEKQDGVFESLILIRKRLAELEDRQSVGRDGNPLPGTPVAPEPDPVPNEHPAVWDLVIADMRQRDADGRVKYGTPLQPFNGRNTLRDLYQELLDAVVYARALIYETEQRANAGGLGVVAISQAEWEVLTGALIERQKSWEEAWGKVGQASTELAAKDKEIARLRLKLAHQEAATESRTALRCTATDGFRRCTQNEGHTGKHNYAYS